MSSNADQIDRATTIDSSTAAVPGQAWRDYLAAIARTDALIEGSSPEGKSREEIQARAEMRMARLRAFLAFLGNPQNRHPIVHVGGTSGKGSTSTAIAAILTAAGYRTGLHTSPYLQVATEKLQIDGRLISGSRFRQLVQSTLDAVDAWITEGGEVLTYGELWVALLARYFAEEAVEIAVIEVGAGGRFDLTNVVHPTVSVITSVGLDHTATLGSTIPEIAWHKAGIIKSGAPVISAVTDPAARQEILSEVANQHTQLIEVNRGATFEILGWNASGARWRELSPPSDEIFQTPLPGRFQAINGATAVAAARALVTQGIEIPSAALHRGLMEARLPGRFELVPDAKRMILDGAHNPEKMRALVSDLAVIAPRTNDQRLIAVVGMLDNKEHHAMMELLATVVDEFVLTTPNVLAKPGASTDSLTRVARSAGFGGPIFAESKPMNALAKAMERGNADRDDVVLVTGSLFVVGDVRENWYAPELIVKQCTSWPRNRDE
jgi:dihydrofolate synthase / folylpolyglutamate synthase